MALLVWLFLVVVWVIFVVDRYYDPQVEHRIYMKHYLIIGLLVFAIPLAVYQVLKIWLEDEVPPFQDIYDAWTAGMAELTKQGLDIAHSPLYLVLGSHDELQEKALFNASQLQFTVRGVPGGPLPLHFYGGPEGVFLVCSQVGARANWRRWHATEKSSSAGARAATAVPTTARHDCRRRRPHPHGAGFGADAGACGRESPHLDHGYFDDAVADGRRHVRHGPSPSRRPM